MGCYIRIGEVTHHLAAGLGSYDLLEAVAIEVAAESSFWLLLPAEDGAQRRIWLSPTLPIELFDDGGTGDGPNPDRVRTLRRSLAVSGQMVGGLAYLLGDDYEATKATVDDKFAAKHADEADQQP